MNLSAIRGIKLAAVFTIAAIALAIGCNNIAGPDTGDIVPLSWHIETVDTEAAGSTGKFCSLELDSSGFPHIAYLRQTGGDLMYARWTGTAWMIEEVDTVGSFDYGISLALDSENHPHISYSRYDVHELRYSCWNGASWDTETLISNGFPKREIFISVDSMDHPYISYNDSGDDGVHCAYHNGVSWTFKLVDSGNMTSIAIGSNDRPHISYMNSDEDLGYARWMGNSWDLQPIDSLSYTCWHNCITLDVNDYPHIVYTSYDFGLLEPDDLKYAYWDGSSWYVEGIDTDADWPSIALDTEGRPRISYWDPLKWDLKYARWDGVAWIVQRIDTVGMVGQYTSIALDDKDHPHISYYDMTNGDLKYARYGE